ncbi:MAG: TIGR02710 family CRISPR-associated CARF protein [Candidatus Binatia bacterium]
MPKAMIVSLGGSPEPLIKTLREQRPQIVCFLASQESVDLLGKVKEAVASGGITFRDYKVLVEDIIDLAHCYQKALSCADWVTKQGVSADDVIVDYTGGTKTMTAALVLATVSRGFGFSYVGGSQRTKGGVGVVESGSEEVRIGANPWTLFAIQEQQRLAQYFNSYQFSACRVLIQELSGHLRTEEKQRFDVLKTMVEGYKAWDDFNHRRALRRLEEATVKLREIVNLRTGGFLASLSEGLGDNLEFLRHLKQETGEFKELLHPLLLSDLFANAKRRIEEGKFDDATARLYRLIEMMGQLEIHKLTGAKTANFPPGEIPEALREEFERRYRSPRDGQIKLSLEATYRLLKERGNEIGQRFYQEHVPFDRIQQARNGSILAHGVTPIAEDRAKEMLDFVASLAALQNEPHFPKLVVE